MFIIKTGIAISVILAILGFTSQDLRENSIQQNQNLNLTADECLNKIDEYDPAIIFNGIRYSKKYNSENYEIDKDNKIGEVKFKMNGMVCPGYIMKEGDATQAEIGTIIYKAKGYSENFRIFVGDQLYEVDNNPNAKLVEDIYDIKGKVKYISLESTENNSHITLFSNEATIQFLDEYLKLEIIDFNQIYNEKGTLGERYFLRLHLSDKSSVLLSYWLEDNIITPGAYGSEELKKIVLNQLERIKIDRDNGSK